MGMVVDFHHHVTPPEYVAELKKYGIESRSGFKLKPSDPAKNLEVMDKLGIDKAYLSNSAPGVYLEDAQTAAKISRIYNRYLKECKDSYPDRYGAFAAVPYPAKSESVSEVEYALDELGFDGVCLMTSANGHYFGEPGHDELFRELDRRNAIVFVHPEDVRVEKGRYLGIVATFERMLETTRSAYNLLFNGYLERYPNIKFIFCHGGGGIPVMARRMATASFRESGSVPSGHEFDRRLELVKGLFFDTAQRGISIVNSLNTFCGSDHIVFGSDTPYVPPFEIATGLKELRAFASFGEKERENILDGNILSSTINHIGVQQ